jgi:hypothetical protein
LRLPHCWWSSAARFKQPDRIHVDERRVRCQRGGVCDATL